MKNLLPPLQFRVAAMLGCDLETSGCDIRTVLAAHKCKCEGPAFYQLMARMEQDGYVIGRRQLVNGEMVRTRRYKITAAGTRALAATRKFYS